jgi:hypothetical protein
MANEGDDGGDFLQRKNRNKRLNSPGRFEGGVDGVDGAEDDDDDDDDDEMDGTDMLSIVLRRRFFLADRGILLSSSVSSVLCSVDDSTAIVCANNHVPLSHLHTTALRMYKST